MDKIAKLHALVQAANGLLPMPVYDELQEQAAKVKGTNFVEVGTAHGAATIALALGASTTKHATKIWTIDKLGGRFSSRSKYGSADNNRRIVIENFRRAGVEKIVELFVGSPDEFMAAGLCPADIDLLLLDADGRIDRDLLHFYPRVKPGAPIIIDDADPHVHLGKNYEGVPYIDLKHRSTFLLLAAFETAGFIRIVRKVEQTAFCERGDREYDPSVITDIALNCYRELVFADAPEDSWKELRAWSEHAADVRSALRIRKAIPPLARKAGGAILRLLQGHRS